MLALQDLSVSFLQLFREPERSAGPAAGARTQDEPAAAI
jgi:hypothetical protein